MNERTFSLAMGEVDERFITEAINYQCKAKRRPVWVKVAHTAAMIALIAVLTLGLLMAASPSIRAAVINWAIEWYDTQIVYRFSGEPADDPNSPLPRYEVTALPKEYEPFMDEIITPGSYDIGYANTNGDLLWFGYQRIEQGGALAIQEGTESITAYDVTVNGCKGRVYYSSDEEEHNLIVWIDEESNLEFDISGFLSKDELLLIAESVALRHADK